MASSSMAVQREDDDLPLPVANYCFMMAVTALAVAPRMPFDRPWTIGGRLSHNFRKLMLFLTATNMLRSALAPFLPYSVVRTVWGIESILISFLSFLTPYVLRVWLSDQDQINVPGGRNPGGPLMQWIFVIAAFYAVGIFLEVVVQNQCLWVFKKIGDALSFIPVTRTITMYNSFATVDGRGTLLSQLLVIGEWYMLLTNCTDITIRTMCIFNMLDAEHSNMFASVVGHNFFALQTRILCHSILLNYLDEICHYQAPRNLPELPPTGITPHNPGNHSIPVETVEDEEGPLEAVPLVASEKSL